MLFDQLTHLHHPRMCLGPACAHTGQTTKGESCCRPPCSYAPSDGPLEVSVSSMKVVSPVPSSPLLLPQSKWNKPVLPRNVSKLKLNGPVSKNWLGIPPDPPYSRVQRGTNYLYNLKSVTRTCFDLCQCECTFYEPVWAPLQQRSRSISDFCFNHHTLWCLGFLCAGIHINFTMPHFIFA